MRSILSLTRSEIEEFLNTTVGEYKISFVEIVEEDNQVQVGVVTTWEDNKGVFEIEDVFEFSQDNLCINDYPGDFSVSYRDFLHAKGFWETRFINITVNLYRKNLLEHIELLKEDILSNLTQGELYTAKMVFDKIVDLVNKDDIANCCNTNIGKEQ